MKLIFISTGVKQHQGLGKPLPKADLYLDCRGIPNPHHAAGVSNLAGSDPMMLTWIRKHGQSHIDNFITQVIGSLDAVPMRRRETSTPFAEPYVVCCMCAYGVHRSVAMKHILAQEFGEFFYDGKDVEVEVK